MLHFEDLFIRMLFQHFESDNSSEIAEPFLGHRNVIFIIGDNGIEVLFGIKHFCYLSSRF